MFFLKNDKAEEGVQKIDEALAQSDYIPHPFFDKPFKDMVKVMSSLLASSDDLITSTTRETVGNVVYDSRLTDELPVEEQKRREALEAGKAFRVPEWWRGEKANYKIAKSMMVTLPKKIGPVRDE